MTTTPRLHIAPDGAFESSTLPTAVTLFSGLGSSSKALRDLGHDVLAHEMAPAAVDTLLANGVDVVAGSVADVDFTNPIYAGVEVLAGGPPCQPFSQAHQGTGRYDERDMIPHFIRAVREIRPRLFVMEEVQTLTWAKHRDYLRTVLSDLADEGYAVDFRVLDASKFGHAQARKRLFIVGRRIDTGVALPEVNWLDADDYEPVTMAERLGWDAVECYARNLQVPDPRAHVTHEGPESLALWPLHRASTTVVGSFRPEVQAAPGYRKAGDGPRQAAPGSVVTTVAERLLLQDMPADWFVCGNEAQVALQVGNSVPCGLLRDLVEVNS